jgi:hypothetical protein
MDVDGELLDVGVPIGDGSSFSGEDQREQGSPFSCAGNSGLTPGSSEPHTPVMPLCGSPPDSDVGVRAMVSNSPQFKER